MDIPDDKRRSVEPYLKFLRRLDDDVPLDTRLFHLLYEYDADDFERLRTSLADVGSAGITVLGAHLETRADLPDALGQLAADGHELIVHGYRHTSFMETSYETAHDELSRSLELIESTTGETPEGFHVPFMAASDGTLRAADDLGIEWVVGRSVGEKPAAGDVKTLQPTHPYDLQLLERGVSPTETFERLEDGTDESSLFLCHPNVHLHHDAGEAFEGWLSELPYSTPGELARDHSDGPGLLLDCFPPFRIV